MELKTRATLTISGSGLALIGAFLPWFSEKFSPPVGILGPIILVVVSCLFFSGGFSTLAQFLHLLGG